MFVLLVTLNRHRCCFYCAVARLFLFILGSFVRLYLCLCFGHEVLATGPAAGVKVRSLAETGGALAAAGPQAEALEIVRGGVVGGSVVPDG